MSCSRTRSPRRRDSPWNPTSRCWRAGGSGRSRSRSALFLHRPPDDEDEEGKGDRHLDEEDPEALHRWSLYLPGGRRWDVERMNAPTPRRTMIARRLAGVAAAALAALLLAG